MGTRRLRYEDNTFTVTTNRFSYWIPVWAPVRKLITETVDGMADHLSGHTDPPQCSGDVPGWAELVDFSTSAVHTCWHDPQNDGRPELLVKSNRGSFLIVTVPLNTSYVWVENQPKWLRRIMSSVSGSGLSTDNAVVLPPGKSVSFGWKRPKDAPVEADVSVYTTQATIGLSAAWWAVDAGYESETSVGHALAAATLFRQ